MEELDYLISLGLLRTKSKIKQLIISIEYYLEVYLIRIMYVGVLSFFGYIYLMAETLGAIEKFILTLIMCVFTASIYWKLWYDYKTHKKWSSLTDKEQQKIEDDHAKEMQAIQNDIEELQEQLERFK